VFQQVVERIRNVGRTEEEKKDAKEKVQLETNRYVARK